MTVVPHVPSAIRTIRADRERSGVRVSFVLRGVLRRIAMHLLSPFARRPLLDERELGPRLRQDIGFTDRPARFEGRPDRALPFDHPPRM
ncbi:MAG TPA: hypothetical protein VEY95_08660 [Azospirillaceae bacterium]|nr:hypothetical protein [Azospirillaceae bacterium]